MSYYRERVFSEVIRKRDGHQNKAETVRPNAASRSSSGQFVAKILKIIYKLLS